MSRLYDAVDRRDADVVRALSHPDMVIHLRAETPEGARTFRGPDGATELWAGLDATFDDYRAEVIEVTTGPDRAVVHCRQSGRFAGGDTRVEGDIFHAWAFRDGKVIEMRHYSTHSEALEAAGLAS